MRWGLKTLLAFMPRRLQEHVCSQCPLSQEKPLIGQFEMQQSAGTQTRCPDREGGFPQWLPGHVHSVLTAQGWHERPQHAPTQKGVSVHYITKRNLANEYWPSLKYMYIIYTLLAEKDHEAT